MPSPTPLAVQIVLFHNPADAIVRHAGRVAAAVRNAIDAALVGEVAVRYGDCGDTPSVDPAVLAEIEAQFASVADISYEVFAKNLGSAGGSNALAARGTEPLVLVLNPDATPAPTTIARMVVALCADVGAADARQLPLEHPKCFDPVSGDTSWVSGACTMLQRAAFDDVSGFDAAHFPMYCDDVDLSWRLRSAGWRTVHAPTAVVVHDKRLGRDGWPAASDFERHNWTVASLLLYHRYGRPDLVSEMIRRLERDEASAWERSALAEYLARVREGRVPARAADVSVASFVDGFDSPHRFRWGALDYRSQPATV